MATSILRLTFQNAEGRRSSLSIRNPVENPSPEDVGGLMEDIINNDVFQTTGGSLVEKVEAVVVTTETNVITDFSG